MANKQPAPFRRPGPPRSMDDFIAGATAEGPAASSHTAANETASSDAAPPEAMRDDSQGNASLASQLKVPASLHPRVQKQLNIRVPETFHYVLKEYVALRAGRKVSMEEFVVQAVREKMEREGLALAELLQD